MTDTNATSDPPIANAGTGKTTALLDRFSDVATGPEGETQFVDPAGQTK